MKSNNIWLVTAAMQGLVTLICVLTNNWTGVVLGIFAVFMCLILREALNEKRTDNGRNKRGANDE